MTGQAWRVDPMSGGAIAWVYVRPHEVAWSVPAAALDELGYWVTEERQNLVDAAGERTSGRDCLYGRVLL